MMNQYSDWTPSDEQWLKRELAKRKRLVDELRGWGVDFEDILQECRIRVWMGLCRYDPTKASRETWMTRQLEFALRDIRRKIDRGRF
jgi:DNA-directed RNA polymerase specialized sigma24 family protein